MKLTSVIATVVLCFQGIVVETAMAVPFGGIEFPQGAGSFADAVILYDPLFNGGPTPTNPDFTDPRASLGVPDFNGNPSGSVSLGRGGILELGFTDNVLTNSGDEGFDLHIFEIGPDVEDTFVAIRPTAATVGLLDPLGDTNADGFFEVGKVFGSTSSLDIDAFFPGFLTGALAFDAVQMIDDLGEGGSSGATVGADIDAVGAISSTPTQVSEPYTFLLISFGLVGIFLVKEKGVNYRI